MLHLHKAIDGSRSRVDASLSVLVKKVLLYPNLQHLVETPLIPSISHGLLARPSDQRGFSPRHIVNHLDSDNGTTVVPLTTPLLL